MTSRCPKCNYPMHCGCNKFCLSKIPEGIKPYSWTDDGECIVCPNCGFTAHADFWLSMEEKEFRRCDADQKIREFYYRHFGHKKFKPPKGIPVSMDIFCLRCGKYIGD